MLSGFGVKWLWGYRKLRCEKCHASRLLNLLMSEGIDYFDLTKEQNGDITLFMLEKEYKILNSILDKNFIKVYSVYGRGLPFVIRAHRNRAGLLAGLAIYFAIIFVSSLFVWDIKVISDTATPHNVIISNLNELGCYEGVFVPSVDFEDLCIDYVEKYRDFSWVSVNVKGTVAYVEIREKQFYTEDPDTPRNLIAAYDGIIEDYSVYEGKSCVDVGNVVKKGDLLVSGVVEDKDMDTRLCHARGRVLATVDAQLTVELPYKYSEEQPTGKRYERKKLRFFNFAFPLPSDNMPDTDLITVTETDKVVLFERIELPLSIEKEVFYEYQTTEGIYTKAEAETVAQRLMRDKFDAELPDAQLLSVTTEQEHTEDSYILTCRVKCRMDISKPAEIST